MPHIFPDSLRENENYPKIWFAVQSELIYLPIPQGLSFGDNMNYSSIDLGLIGDAALESIKALTSSTPIGESGKSLFNSVMKKLETDKAPAAALIASTLLADQSATQIIGLGVKKIVPPNTNSLFQGSAIRQFGFQFRLVSRTETESRTAKAIVNVFRKYMYPVGTPDSLLLSYPDIWKIGWDYANLPKIYDCYLTSLTTTYNSSTNAFFNDDEPLETDVSLTFQETRALTRGDLYSDTSPTPRNSGGRAD